MMASVAESSANPLLVSLRQRLLPILRDILMYEHNGLVSTALALIFRLTMMRSETTSLLQEVQLLQSSEMVDFYGQACTHAVRLQSFFNNKTNLKGQWCDAMLQELEWFILQVACVPCIHLCPRPPRHSASARAQPLCLGAARGPLHRGAGMGKAGATYASYLVLRVALEMVRPGGWRQSAKQMPSIVGLPGFLIPFLLLLVVKGLHRPLAMKQAPRSL